MYKKKLSFKHAETDTYLETMASMLEILNV